MKAIMTIIYIAEILVYLSLCVCTSILINPSDVIEMIYVFFINFAIAYTGISLHEDLKKWFDSKLK